MELTTGAGDAVPHEVRAALEGRPAVGSWDAMFPLLTVGEDGFAAPCWLSRSELAVAGASLLAAVAGHRPVADLRRDHRATLVVVGDRASWSCRLETTSFDTSEPGLTGVVFDVRSVEADGAGVRLEPPRFLPTADLAVEERWAAVGGLLDRMAAAQASRAPGGDPRANEAHR